MKRLRQITLITVVLIILSFNMGMGIFAPPSRFKEFASVEELDTWCRKNITILLVSDARGRIDFNNPVVTSLNDCDDYAERLQILALNAGYLMSCQLARYGQVYGVTVTDNIEGHMGNLVMMGNAVYYIEPNPCAYKIIYLCPRD